MNDKIEHNPLFVSIKQLIEESKQQVATAVNAAITALYWQVGSTIKNEVLRNSRAEYGQQVVQSL